MIYIEHEGMYLLPDKEAGITEQFVYLNGEYEKIGEEGDINNLVPESVMKIYNALEKCQDKTSPQKDYIIEF